jgi:hypothetical protein
VQLLAHPFTVLANGRVATVEQDSDASNAQLLAVLLLTRLDERPLEPGFGTTDPTFLGLDITEVAAAVTAYGPDITLGDVTVDDVGTPGAQLIQIQFT